MTKSSTIIFQKAITPVMAFLLFSAQAVLFSTQAVLFSAQAVLLFSAQAAPSYAEGSNEEPSANKTSHHVYFSVANEHGFPLKEERKNFDCEDKIHTVIELSNFKPGKHSLSVVWTDPSSTDRERTEYDFHVREQNTRLWTWLTLSRANGAGMLQWINPAAGLEEFIGPWKVVVRIDNKEIETKKFEVSC